MASSRTIDALASTLVARFLRKNNYSDTLKAFIREADLAPDVMQDSNDVANWTIQSLIEEKKTFDQTVSFERYGDDKQESTLWSQPAPSNPFVVQTTTPANQLAVAVEQWQRPSNHDGEDVAVQSYIVSTGSDKQVHLYAIEQGNATVTSFQGMSDSPVLSFASILEGRYILMTNMAGKLYLLHGSQMLDSRKDHKHYAVRVVVHHDRQDAFKWWVATAGWDEFVCLYHLNIPQGNASALQIGEPIARIKLGSKPESLVFAPHLDTEELLLLVSRRDSPYIYFYQVEGDPTEDRLLGRQNLAPHSNSWVAFCPAYMALSPHDPGLLAVAVSSLPHLKVMFLRLLFPTTTAKGDDATSIADHVTQASQAMASLAIQNREDAAILIQANTFAPQTDYSTPQLTWRPDGSGVWVSGDDGVIRGVERKTGKVVALLKGGHEPDRKVRTIWSGYVAVPQESGQAVLEEWVLSGGFDQRLIVWKV